MADQSDAWHLLSPMTRSRAVFMDPTRPPDGHDGSQPRGMVPRWSAKADQTSRPMSGPKCNSWAFHQRLWSCGPPTRSSTSFPNAQLALALSRPPSYFLGIMAPTTSFAPIAERLATRADEIRSDLDGRPMIEQIYGVMWCIMLYCFVRICHALDARAEAQLTGADEMRRAPQNGHANRPASRQLGTPIRIRLVASRDDGSPIAASLGMPVRAESSLPGLRGAIIPTRLRGMSFNHGPPRSWGGKKTSVFWLTPSHVYFVALS